MRAIARACLRNGAVRAYPLPFFFAAVLVLFRPAAQDKAVDAAFGGTSIDLLPHLLSVETDKPVVTIRTADDESSRS